MNSLKTLLALVILATACLSGGNAFAAGASVSDAVCTKTDIGQDYVHGKNYINSCVVTWTSDDTSAGDQTKDLELCGYVMGVSFNPTGSPTDNYDVRLLNPDGADVFGGSCDNRDTTNSEYVQPAPATGGQWPPVLTCETYTLSILNNTATSAGGTITFILQ